MSNQHIGLYISAFTSCTLFCGQFTLELDEPSRESLVSFYCKYYIVLLCYFCQRSSRYTPIFQDSNCNVYIPDNFCGIIKYRPITS